MMQSTIPGDNPILRSFFLHLYDRIYRVECEEYKSGKKNRDISLLQARRENKREVYFRYPLSSSSRVGGASIEKTFRSFVIAARRRKIKRLRERVASERVSGQDEPCSPALHRLSLARVSSPSRREFGLRRDRGCGS